MLEESVDKESVTEELVPDLRANDVNLKELKENDLLQPIFEGKYVIAQHQKRLLDKGKESEKSEMEDESDSSDDEDSEHEK